MNEHDIKELLNDLDLTFEELVENFGAEFDHLNKYGRVNFYMGKGFRAIYYSIEFNGVNIKIYDNKLSNIEVDNYKDWGRNLLNWYRELADYLSDWKRDNIEREQEVECDCRCHD